MTFLTHFYQLFLESAPWLLFGLIVAGVLKVFIPMAWMNKQLGGHDAKTTIKAALIGAPLPLCSCGVIPAAIGLRRAGASKAATTSFLVSTPETGIDSMSVSYVLLGPFMTIVRPVSAIFSAIVAGLLVGKDEETKNLTPQPKETSSCCSSTSKEEVKTEKNTCCSSKTQAVTKSENASCCASKAPPEAKVEAKEKAESASSCCAKKDTKPASVSLFKKLKQGLLFSSTNLINDITLWLLVGLSFAALVQAYLPDEFLAQWGDGILAMLVMVLVSIPMYICATASTPIAAGLLLAGVSPGAVLVFMLAGPATNIATLGVVTKELGKKALLSYLTGVIGGALLCGYLVNIAVAQFAIQVAPQIGHQHALLPSWLTLSSAAILATLMSVSILKSIKKLTFKKTPNSVTS